jgi:hypothetical protein
MRHGAARAVHVVGDWCQKIVGELDATAAHLNGDPTPVVQVTSVEPAVKAASTAADQPSGPT